MQLQGHTRQNNDKSWLFSFGAVDIWPDIGSVLLGIFQGLCCPMGLVGISFVANLHSAGIAVFVVTFLLVSALGTGCFASTWATLMHSQMVSKSSSRTAYRASCLFTLGLGATWIVANYFGVLDKLNYAEHHHSGMHNEHQHA